MHNLVINYFAFCRGTDICFVNGYFCSNTGLIRSKSKKR